MMEQVLVNLVVNARDAMPQGGQVLIVTETVSLDEDYVTASPEARVGEFVVLSVSDSGTGIAPQHLPHIFEPFFSTKETGKGTGLGLATVHGILKQHRGWVEVTSQLGAGSTFKVFLPTTTSAAQTPKEPLAEKPSRGVETILLVEDEEAVRSAIRRSLEKFGYRVHEAASGREALELCRDQMMQIDLVLTDIIMPEGVNGLELAETLQAQRPSLKLILMSGYSGPTPAEETGFMLRTKSPFLHKPCSCRELIETVRQCLDAPSRPN
jgi:CheY-like chemotaxis protein